MTSYLSLILVALTFSGLLLINYFVNSVIAAPIKELVAATLDPHPNLPTSKIPLSHGMALKIVSPVKGQHIPTGTNLTVTGASSDNSSTNCQISLLLNDLKPYQKTTPTGKSSSGGEDYSSWRYVLNNSTYSSIKQGINKITSQMTCANTDQPRVINAGVSKWYSINVTGVPTKTAQSTPKFVTRLPASNNLNHSDTSLTSKVNSSKPSPLRLTTSVYKPIQPTNIAAKSNTNSSVKPDANIHTLAVSLEVGKNPITTGQKQTVKVVVTDSATNAKVAGAKVTTDIQPSSSSIVERQFVGITGPDGKVSKTWKMGDGGRLETTYNIYSTISAPGYQYKTISGTFRASAPQNDAENISNKVDDLSNKIINEVKKGFDENALMPKLPLPFN
ncbi:MAG: hypothetical protein ACTHKP_01125 [Nitrososphaeraceae archaeon]